MSSPCGGSAHPKLFYSVADLTDMLDCPAVEAGVPAAPAVKVVDLPDRPAARRKTQTSPATKATAVGEVPWWVSASPDVVLVEPATNSEPPIVVATSRPAWPSFINWKLVGTVGGGAAACLLLMVVSAWAASRGTFEVAAAEPMVIKHAATTVATVTPPTPAPKVVGDIVPKQFLAEARVAEQMEKEYAVKAAKLDAVLALLDKKNEPAAKEPEKCAECEKAKKGSYGTAIEFVSNPIEAAEQALANKKLLLVLTISGNFEEAKFT